jgi:hypothetical protein
MRLDVLPPLGSVADRIIRQPETNYRRRYGPFGLAFTTVVRRRNMASVTPPSYEFCEEGRCKHACYTAISVEELLTGDGPWPTHGYRLKDIDEEQRNAPEIHQSE